MAWPGFIDTIGRHSAGRWRMPSMLTGSSRRSRSWGAQCLGFCRHADTWRLPGLPRTAPATHARHCMVRLQGGPARPAIRSSHTPSHRNRARPSGRRGGFRKRSCGGVGGPVLAGLAGRAMSTGSTRSAGLPRGAGPRIRSSPTSAARTVTNSDRRPNEPQIHSK